MAVSLLASRNDGSGAGPYNLYDVRPVPGAVGGGPQDREPFSPAGAFAIDEVEAAGHGRGFAVDIGNGYAHVYVRQSAPRSTGSGQTRQPTQQPTRTTVETAPVIRVGPTRDVTRVPEGGAINALINFARGLVGKAIKPWAKMSPNTAPATVWAAAEPEESNLVAVAGLLQSVNNPAEGISGVVLYWVGQQRDGTWFVPISYLPDIDIPEVVGNLLIDTNRLYRGSTPDGPSEPPLPGSPQELRYGALGEILGVPPTKPRIVQIRRCGKGMRLGIDGACYPKRLLTAATRMNSPKKAKISYRDWQTFKKSKSVKDSILKAAEDVEHEEKEHSHRHRHR